MLFNATPETKVGATVLLLVAALFLLSDRLGLLADKDAMLLQQRTSIVRQLSELIANDVSTHNYSRIPSSLRRVVEQHGQLLSAQYVSSVVTTEVVASNVEDTDAFKASSVDDMEHLLVVPVFGERGREGQLELRFDPNEVNGFAAISTYSLAVMIFVATALAFLSFRLLMLGYRTEEEGSGSLPERIKQAFDSLAEGVLILDSSGRIAHANQAFKSSFTGAPIRLEGAWPHELAWKNQEGESIEAGDLPWAKVLITGERVVGDKLRLEHEGQPSMSFAVNCTPLHESFEDHRGVLVTLDNMSELEKRNAMLRRSIHDLSQNQINTEAKNRELQILASRDSLTDCLNRRSFNEKFKKRYQQSLESSRTLACIMVDIDHFKRVNDNYGHTVGDKVIRFVASVLSDKLRHDDLVGRYGGEEFCLVIDESTPERAFAAAERMRREIANGDHGLLGAALRTTASFGVACMDGDDVGREELIQRADRALYLAKESGRNKVMLWDEKASGCESTTEIEEVKDESDTDASAAKILRGSFCSVSNDERECLLEELTEKYSPVLAMYHLPEMGSEFNEQSMFVDRVENAMLLARREARPLGVLSVNIAVKSNGENRCDVSELNASLGVLVGRMRDKLRVSDTVSVFPSVTNSAEVSETAEVEVGILMPTTRDAESVAWVAQRLQDALQEPLHAEGGDLSVASHFGISVYPGDAETSAELVRAANVARYFTQFHEDQQGIEFFTASRNVSFRDKLLLQSQLMEALEKDQFEVLYQPKIELATNEVCGFESLLRWNHPQKGTLMPNDFLNVAERSRIINLIGDWVLRESCRQIKAFSSQIARPLVASINLSSVQLAQPDLADQVFAAIEEEDFDPQNLHLELHEDDLESGLVKRYEKLTSLRERGVKIAIDNFGAGCSSLHALRNLPIDVLKIDRCFVADIDSNENDSAMVSAIVALARSFDFTVVAEGVESKAQFDELTRIECTEAQGYLLGRPMSCEAVKRFLADSSHMADVG